MNRSMYLSVLTLMLSVSFLCQARQPNLCEQYKHEISTKIKLTLALNGGKSQTREFVVADCRNDIFTAFDNTENSTMLRYRAGQGDVRRIRFVGMTKNASELQPIIDGTWNIKTGDVTLANGPQQCPVGEHWDASMNMCMRNDCPPGQHWDQSMNMCMPGSDRSAMVMFHYNQFLVYTDSSGPRGRGAFTAPNMWMLMVDKKTSDNNSVGVNWMGTTDLWTVPTAGTPELLQTGEANSHGMPYVDAQHPHSTPIMGLTFYDVLSLGANGEKKLTFFFAPRGEATAGPEAFMHRETGELNPDAPLSHHLQDVFHISSTVIGMKLAIGRLTLEGSMFSGQEPSPGTVNLDMHTPDSYGFRANYQASDNVSIGGSYAKVAGLDHENNPTNQIDNEHFYSAWATTNNMIKNGKLVTTTIWGQNNNVSAQVKLNSFLEEFVYELSQSNFYGRFEVLQRAPNQLEIQLTDGATGAKWVKALTLGYERQIESRGKLKVYIGAAATTYDLPAEFQPTYGHRPIAAKVYFRVNYGGGDMAHDMDFRQTAKH